MRKVLQISNYYYPNFGGIEQVARDISNVLRDETDYENKVICFNEDSRDGEYVCHRKETIYDNVDGTEIIKCGCFAKISSQSLSASFGKELKRVMNEYQPDIVIFHYPNPFQARYLLKYRKKDFKLLLYWHLDITKQTLLKRLFHRQNMALIDRMNYVLGATPMHVDASEYTFAFKNKKIVLPYMIDTAKLILTEEEEKKATEIRQRYKNQVIGFFVGRHVPYKGLKYLVEASSELTDIPLKIIIAGSGELTEQLKQQADGDSKIEFIGRISDSEKRSYYKACDLMCFPSITRNEAFGLVLAEGMYFEKPAITFHIYGSGVNYVNVADETGIECPNCDSHAYAEALKKLVLDESLRKKMGRAAAQRVKDKFTPEQFRKNLIDILNSI